MSNFLITSTNTVNQLTPAESLNSRVDSCIWWYYVSIYITQQQKATLLKCMLILSRLKPSHRINKNKTISYDDTFYIFMMFTLQTPPTSVYQANYSVAR
jgi:hypothetical protein